MKIEIIEKTQTVMNKDLTKVLLVEDDVVDVRLVERILDKFSEPVKFAVESVDSLSEAIERLTNREYDIVIADLELPDSSGIKTIQKLKQVIPDTPIVVLTGVGDEEIGLSAIRNGASDYLVKDLPLNVLLVRTIRYALEHSNVEKEVKALRQQLEFILGATKTGIDIIDSEFNIRYINSEWKKVYGDPSGKKCYEYFMDRSEVCPGCGIIKALKTKKPVVTEEVLVKEGNRPIQVTTIPFQNEKKEWLVAEVNVDITEREMENKLILDTNRRLQETSQELFMTKRKVEKKAEALHEAHAKLELRVKERTAKLSKANELLIKEITKRKQAEEALHTTEANLRKVIVTSPDGIVIVNREGIVQFVNPAAESLFGRKAEELIGELFGFPVVGSKVIEVDIVKHGGGPGIAEMRVVETEWNSQNAYLALIRDITERKCAKEQIELAAKEWRTTFDSITDMISIHDKNCRIIRINKALANAFRKEPKELIGKTCYKLFHGTKQPCPNCPHMLSLKTQKPATLELFEPRLGIHLGISTSPILDEHGEVMGSVHIAKNITDRKKAEETLKEANKKLTEYSQLKDEFVSTASHELRTPLSIIQGAIRLILDEIPGNIIEGQREVLATAMENVKRLGRIVESLLNISRIESGKLDLHKTVVNICELIKDTVADYKALSQEKGICLDCEVPQRSIDICIDLDKTKEVLINLISNSIKFTSEGGWVKVVCAERDGEVLVSIQDSGVGIAKEDIPKLFDKFTQFGRKAGPGEKGTGLGLAIAKKLVEMHSGKIEVQSEVDQGTTFIVSLPFAPKDAAKDLSVETDKLVESTITDNETHKKYRG